MARPLLWARLARAAPVIFVVSLVTLGLEQLGWLDGFETTGIDAVLLLRAPKEMRHVSVVALTEREYDSEYAGKRAFTYNELARVINAVAAGGASVIGVDIDTSAPPFRRLRLKPTKARIVWVAGATNSGRTYVPSKPLGGARTGAADIGLAVGHEDPDGVVRRYSRDLQTAGGMRRSFSWAVVREYCRVQSSECSPKLKNAPDDIKERFINFSGARGVPSPIPFHAAMALPEEGLAGRIVLVGAAISNCDVVRTPLGPKPGVYVLAEAIESDLSTGGIQPISNFLAFILDIVVGACIVIIHFYMRLRSAVTASLLAIPVLSLASSFLAFSSFARWFNFVPMIVAVLIHELYEHGKAYRDLQAAYNKLLESRAP